MQISALPVFSKAGAHMLPLPTCLFLRHHSVRPGEPCTTQEHLIQEMPLASKRLSLDLASGICWRPRLAGEEGMHCWELLIIIYQANLLQRCPCSWSLNLHSALGVNTSNPTLNYLKLSYSCLGSCLCKTADSKPQNAYPVQITLPHSFLYLNETVSKQAPISLRKEIHFKRGNKTVSFLQWKGS